MPSSFSLFRRHQRVMMAVLGVLIMIAFSLGGVASLESGLFGSRGPGNPVVATTAFGEIREINLQNMEVQRQIAKDFVRRILYATITDPRQMSQQMQNYIDQLLDLELVRAIEQARGHRVADSGRLARKEGLVVNDDTVTDFLRAITGDRVPAERFQQELNQMRIRGQQRVAKSMVYDALRTELLARNFRTMFSGGLQTTPARAGTIISD